MPASRFLSQPPSFSHRLARIRWPTLELADPPKPRPVPPSERVNVRIAPAAPVEFVGQLGEVHWTVDPFWQLLRGKPSIHVAPQTHRSLVAGELAAVLDVIDGFGD